MACEQCLHDDEEILAIRRRHHENAEQSGQRSYYHEDLPSHDCDRGECQNAE